MNNSCWLQTTFCRKCKKLKSCLDTHNVSDYRYLCKSCLDSENLLGNCRSCGREGIKSELDKHGGYCHLHENDNISECNLCGAEVYTHSLNEGVCQRCNAGDNKPCIKCGTYLNKNKLNEDGLCKKCSLKIYKQLKKSNLNEVVECIECGRECHVNDLENGLCMFCYADNLFKKKNKRYSY